MCNLFLKAIVGPSLAALFVMCLAVVPGQAQIFTWTGAVDNQFFSVPGNWSPNGIPNNLSQIRFSGAATAGTGLRMFDGTTVAETLVIDGGSATLRPEGVFNSNILEVGGSASGSSGSFSSLFLVDFNGSSRMVSGSVNVATLNLNMQATGNFGNLQIGSGTELLTTNIRVGQNGNTGFMSIIGGGEVTSDFLSVGLSGINISTSGSLLVQGAGSSLTVNGLTEIGRIILDGVDTTGSLDATANAIVFLADADLGCKGATGTINANDSFVGGDCFTLGLGGGAGHLRASSGGTISVDMIESLSIDSSLLAENGGLISAPVVNISAGEIAVEGGVVEVLSDLDLQSGQLNISSGLGDIRSLTASGSGSIQWTGGDIWIRDDFTVVADGGLFNLQTIVPSAGNLILDNDILILSELQVDGALMASRIYSFGDLVLNDATITGKTELSGSSTSFVDGVVNFNGMVTGRGQFVGANSTVRFLDGYEPGNDTEGAVSIGFDGSVELASGSTLDLEIFGSESGQYDRLDIGGELIVAGELIVSCPNGFVPEAGDEFMIAEVDGAVTGEFQSLSEGAVVANMGGVELSITYLGGDGNDVVLYVNCEEALIGDVNLDGAVNLLDVQPFIDLVGSGTFQAEADTNQDGLVNLLDVDPFIALLAG